MLPPVHASTLCDSCDWSEACWGTFHGAFRAGVLWVREVEANRGSCLGEGWGIENSGARPLSSETGKKPTLFSGVPKPTIPNEQWQRTSVTP